MTVEEALVITSLVIIILAVFFAKEKEFYSANEAYVLIDEEDAKKCISKFCHIQQLNNFQRRKCKTMWAYPRPKFRFKDLVVELENPVGSVGL